MPKTYKVSLTLVVEIGDEALKFYEKSSANLHEALTSSEKAILKMEETEEPPQEHWLDE